MLFSLLYKVVRVFFRLVPSGSGRDREIEILVLRHQVKVLKRKTVKGSFIRIRLPTCGFAGVGLPFGDAGGAVALVRVLQL